MTTEREPLLKPVAVEELRPPRTQRRSANSCGPTFLPRRIDRSAVAKNFDKAMKQALVLAKSKDADYLPGWCGPTSD